MPAGRRIGVVGAGLMGHGIALTMARAGHTVHVQDAFPEALSHLRGRVDESLRALGIGGGEAVGILNRIEASPTIAEAVEGAEAVFEAAPEKLGLKQSVFAEIEQHAPPEAILASNTSVIPITRIMAGLSGRSRALGTHWWNPPHMIPLVEIVKTEWTADAAVEAMAALLDEAGKTTVIVEKDVPGFIGNRLQHALWREAISLVENGICEAEAVDTVVKSSFGRRLAVLGPLENADLIGTDLTLDIHENVLFDLEGRKKPSPYLRQLVRDGRLGMKSGNGFRDWTDEQARTVRGRIGSHLLDLERILSE